MVVPSPAEQIVKCPTHETFLGPAERALPSPAERVVPCPTHEALPGPTEKAVVPVARMKFRRLRIFTRLCLVHTNKHYFLAISIIQDLPDLLIENSEVATLLEVVRYRLAT